MSGKNLHLLISAYACEPGRGSEPGVGWNLVSELSSMHQLTVMTRANNQKAIKSSSEPWVKTVKWIWVDPPRSLTFWKKKGRGIQLFYILWQIAAYRKAKQMVISGQSFDLIHHITLGKYWIPSLLPRLGIPFVFGPVGGGDLSPPKLAKHYPWRGKIEEYLRAIIHRSLHLIPGIPGLYRKAAWTFAATEQTMVRLKELGVNRISILPQSGIGEEEIKTFEGLTSRSVIMHERRRLRVLTACRLIPWKGVDLAIEALAHAHAAGTVSELRILSDGPERERLETLAKRLGISDRVTFLGTLPKLSDVYREMAEADVLIHPALHEAFGQCCLESLAIGTPVICLDWAGPGMIVDETCGWRVKPGTRDETISGIAASIISAQRMNDEQRARYSEAGKNRVRQYFSWDQIAITIANAYVKCSKHLH